MGKLSGIKKLDFDCKTATLTMKHGASLSREAATEALVKAGFGVTKIEGGDVPRVTTYVFRVTGIDPAQPALARSALVGALDAPEYIAIDATGAAAVTLRGNTPASEAELGDSLRKAGFGLEEFSIRAWPRDRAVYVMELQDVNDVSSAQRARTALVALDKVFWAEVHPQQKSAVIFLNEPCNEIEVKVRGALGNLGYAVPQFRLDTR